MPTAAQRIEATSHLSFAAGISAPPPPPGEAPDLSGGTGGKGKKKWREMLSRPDVDYEGLFGTAVTEDFGASRARVALDGPVL